MIPFRTLGTAFAASLLVPLAPGCDDDGTAPAADTTDGTFPSLCEGGGRAGAPGCTGGTLVGPDGAAVENVRVSACTPSTCITSTSDASGRFVIQGLPVEPHKLEVLGFIQGFYTTVYYMDMTAGSLTLVDAPIRLQRLPPALVKGFEPSAGGQLVLAGGDVVIDADPAALSFPIGTSQDGAEATAVAIADLPPFDVAPWAGKESGAFAYLVHPFPLRSDGGVSLGLAAPEGVAEASAYTLYSVHTSTARVEEVGAMTRGDDGLWRLDDPTRLGHLAVLVAVPAD